MRRTLLLFVPLMLVMAGCAKPEAAFVGKWQYADTIPKTANAQTDAQVAAEMAKIVIDVKADKTFSAVDRSGTYAVSGKTMTLTMSNPKSDDDKKPATATLSDDGKTLSFTFPGTPEPAKFSKVGG
jgi:hypothetical protein